MSYRFQKRILKEIESLQKGSLNNIKIADATNVREIKIEITGAEETLYTDEVFILRFNLPDNYPIESPEVMFVGIVPLNEHVYSNGHICLSILYDQWSPALTLESVCLSIISLLSGAKEKKRPPNDTSYCKVSKNKSPKDFRWSYHGH